MGSDARSNVLIGSECNAVKHLNVVTDDSRPNEGEAAYPVLSVRLAEERRYPDR